MHPVINYDVYIFDCDGVILDSNQLKIDAMHNALSTIISDSSKVEKCVDYFRVNFGLSRFHHVDMFIEQFLQLDKNIVEQTKKSILDAYSKHCRDLYLKADLTPDVIDFINELKGTKFVASGSEQEELRDVFKLRGLDTYFDGIYGSPIKKSDLIANILELVKSNNAIMFGDAISDFEAAKTNNIDFIGYLPYSNVREKLEILTGKTGDITINKWSELS
ncbi:MULTISPECIES: HAD family hydrolase [unclassified Pseudoalteromonas]|uniref:HAD family hydrolase n=1 Tax=unclassified Pseudoalteromonas TaxID=194690 RepID=UPI0023589571|nr:MULTISPECIES: HAD hydrolase-like protein [unclassified Pseudoalteromonas]MDC9565594.1 HAD hydrolase-like protein [Pseudoalteromonas sp. GAB2316C]MDC9569901.1 HAD hydrolase-like protein [Pseudoalteromonas sp. GABNB9D]MDC9574036.1 HAD hydrolase-like protein [Pseudoalteromonas sp. GABNS16A]MDC9578142.1 HAD hydrolase-like protein [Pseudoalteromonas sp. GABNS16E]MDC9584964.1 HAD hydrolase-like protein [Pseudoalteromonas sp. GABNS16C]